MKIEEALAIIEQVCSEFKGTLKDHQMIQQALKQVRIELEKPALVFDGEQPEGNE